MKKQVIFAVLVAASALAGMNVAQAQDGSAECLASGLCGHTARERGLDANGHYDPRVYQREVENGTAAPNGKGLSGMRGRQPTLAGNRPANTWPHGGVTPYPRTSRDRDGDGVPNSRDRYPDDPRYR